MSKFCGESLPTSGSPGHFESRAFFLGLHCWVFELHSHDCAAPSFELTKSRRNPLSVDVLAFGPIVELASEKLLVTLNPLFTGQVGPNRETEGLGFEYGWRAEYDFAKHWGIGVEMFVEIDDLSNAGTFNRQNHSIGPTLFWSPTNKEEDVGDAAGGNKSQGPAPLELSFNVGVQLGLTDATSDTALKFQGSLSF